MKIAMDRKSGRYYIGIAGKGIEAPGAFSKCIHDARPIIEDDVKAKATIDNFHSTDVVFIHLGAMDRIKRFWFNLDRG